MIPNPNKIPYEKDFTIAEALVSSHDVATKRYLSMDEAATNSKLHCPTRRVFRQSNSIVCTFSFVAEVCSQMKIGYARVSTDDPNMSLQLDALQAAGCDKVFQDHLSGAAVKRPGLDAALAALQLGDVLTVWRLDRLGRTMPHLVSTVADFRRARNRISVDPLKPWTRPQPEANCSFTSWAHWRSRAPPERGTQPGRHRSRSQARQASGTPRRPYPGENQTCPQGD
jgi:Resolvase, N terminal domain